MAAAGRKSSNIDRSRVIADARALAGVILRMRPAFVNGGNGRTAADRL
jgi:hypothetical protein